MQAKILTLTVALALALAAPANADTSAQASAVLTNVAAHVSHGFADYALTMPALEAKIAQDDHVSVLCGQVSMLGVRALERAGIPARYVGTFASQRADLFDVPADVVESHALLEAWTGGRWELYDLDSNVQPVDAAGQPVTIQQFADAPIRSYRVLATDPLYDPTGDQYPVYEAWLFANHETWYDRVLDVVTIQQGGHYIYTGAKDSLVSTIPGYEWVTPEQFSAWAAAGPVPLVRPAPAPKPQPTPAPAPVVAPMPVATVAPAPVEAPAPAAPEPTVAPAETPPPAPAPAPAASAPVAPVVPQAPVVRLHRPFVTRTRHGKVFHVYGLRSRHPRWVYVRRIRPAGTAGARAASPATPRPSRR